MRATAIQSAFLCGLALALAASSARAQIIREPDRAPPRPSAEAMARFYPDAAKTAHVGGRVVLSCEARPSGTIGACAVRSESPTGYGFGKAALDMSARMRLGERACVAGPCRIEFPVDFRPGL